MIKNRAIFADRLARKAGRLIKKADPGKDVSEKEGRGNYVTWADLASERLIMDAIKKEYPTDQILSEETAPKLKNISNAESLWVIDPIDGTNNFYHRRNYSAVSIAYVERGEIKIGAAYDPFRNELFFAEKGSGAFLNKQKIVVGSASKLEKSTVATDNWYDHRVVRKNLETLLKIKRTPWTLIKGSAVLAICDVACGRVDLYFHRRLNPWDIAASLLILREAGGSAIDFSGADAKFNSPGIAVGNKKLINKFKKIIEV